MEKENLKEGVDDYSILSLDDFIGSAEMYSEVGKIFREIANANLFRVAGSEPDKSYLFYGPPGTGKTHLVDCMYWELFQQNRYFGLKEYSIGTHGTAFINVGSVNLQKFFDEGKKGLDQGKFGGIIYKFDECDVILTQREESKRSHKEDEKLLSTLMINLQRIHNDRTNEFVFFMTNFEGALDAAATRVGRIDKYLKFNLPDYESRKRLFQYEVTKINNRSKYRVIKNYNLDTLAEISDGMNNAEISDISRRAVKNKIHSFLQVGGDKMIDFNKMGVRQGELETEILALKKERGKKEKRIGFI
ncbi:ATP-binding protein [Candidatus Pacearchaeota archaeon]|nr:ATP-binding protein [Candidatus Pacearchaeota archaeon]